MVKYLTIRSLSVAVNTLQRLSDKVNLLEITILVWNKPRNIAYHHRLYKNCIKKITETFKPKIVGGRSPPWPPLSHFLRSLPLPSPWRRVRGVKRKFSKFCIAVGVWTPASTGLHLRVTVAPFCLRFYRRHAGKKNTPNMAACMVLRSVQ